MKERAKIKILATVRINEIADWTKASNGSWAAVAEQWTSD
jgi:hypothetical protein